MTGSHDNKSSPQFQGVTDLELNKESQSSVTHQLHPTHSLRTPTPRTYNGKEYYCASDVAKIIGVSRIAVVKWNNELWHGAQWFTADLKTHDGVYLYEIERVEQLKSVYHPKWTRGGYETAPFDDNQSRIAENITFFSTGSTENSLNRILLTLSDSRTTPKFTPSMFPIKTNWRLWLEKLSNSP